MVQVDEAVMDEAGMGEGREVYMGMD